MLIPKTDYYRSEKHRRFVASLDCLFCEWPDTQAAHATIAGKGLKDHDYFCLPMCVPRGEYKGCHKRYDQYEIHNGDRSRFQELGKLLFEATGQHAKAQRILHEWRSQQR